MAVMIATATATEELETATATEVELETGVDSLTTPPSDPDTIETDPILPPSESEVISGPAAEAAPLPLDVGELQREIRLLRRDISIREQWENEIADHTAVIDRHAARVMRAQSDVSAAKGELKAAEELYNQAVNELRNLLKDHSNGQQRLPFDATATTTAVDGVTITTPSDEAIAASLRAAGVDAEAAAAPDHGDSPIEVLLTKEIKQEFGDELIQQAKDRDEPIGMTPKQLEKLHECDVRTIGKLEKRMREDRHWAEELGLGEKTAARLVETLRVWRTMFPHVEVEPEAEPVTAGSN